MGDRNQQLLVSRYREALSGPFLEIGSKNYGNTQNLRELFPGESYVGADMSPGENVDCVVDFTADFQRVDAMLGHRRFGTIFCFSVLEHCEQPFVMAANMTRLLQPGGKIVLSVPFAWKFHGYPSDYWRFTHEGIRKLFPAIDWDTVDAGLWHTPGISRFHRVDESLGKLRLSAGHQLSRNGLRAGLGMGILKLLRPLGLFSELLANRYLLVPTMVDMIGVLKPDGTEPPS